MLILPYWPRTSERVNFSSRAHAAIVAETHAQHPNETGGILLGHHSQGRWHVMEAIDPGPGAQFTPTTFEYDTAYVTHLARKLAGVYEQPLSLIGLWHRHPGSFDRFSAEDDVTNRRYAEQSPAGAISCLVNLDPHFRITAYHVPADLAYRRLPISCGDLAIPRALLVPRHRRCLHPAALEHHRQQRVLQSLLAAWIDCSTPQPLAQALTALLEPLLEQLEAQERFAYALQPCGSDLCLALVERSGRQQRALRLQAIDEQLWVQVPGSQDRVPFELEQLSLLWTEPCHA
jgi:proteasome lid subunit RPN8/RPN11